jgi:hypothetical protein
MTATLTSLRKYLGGRPGREVVFSLSTRRRRSSIRWKGEIRRGINACPVSKNGNCVPAIAARSAQRFESFRNYDCENPLPIERPRVARDQGALVREHGTGLANQNHTHFPTSL